MMLLRHLLAILLLPFIVVIVVPYLLLAATATSSQGGDVADLATRWGDGLPLRVLGVILFIGGLALFCWCVTLFAIVGGAHWPHGTRHRRWSRQGRTDMYAIR